MFYNTIQIQIYNTYDIIQIQYKERDPQRNAQYKGLFRRKAKVKMKIRMMQMVIFDGHESLLKK